MERRLIKDEIYNKLPLELQNLANNFEGRERDIVLISNLVVLSNCFPNISGVYHRDRVFPHLFALIIAPAASGKGVMGYSRILIEKIHKKIYTESLAKHKESFKKSRKDVNVEVEALQVKILPANISTSEMYSYLGSSSHGLIIIESEADTLSNMLKNDWSNYSDVLRKVFQHEPISISRKVDRVFEDISEPKLSVLISGTPHQLQPLVNSTENGLYSRFMIYNFDEISPLKNVFDSNARNVKEEFEKLGTLIFETYGKLSEINNLIEFSFSEAQQSKFLDLLSPIREDVITNHYEGFIASVHRHGLIMFRIAMILTIVRNLDGVEKNKELVCSDVDFDISYEIMTTLLRHSQYTYDTIDTGGLSIQDEELLDKMKLTFSRQELITAGQKMDIPKRTIDDKIAQWKGKRIIKKVNRNNFIKLSRR
ncbi:DUF3987 domain-containing protein [Flavobacterium oreochromis]|uniref:DUF3987 domain-containing protein n=1 Tax=Flavobacterium oreochromis TaxID=2906078 RepID=A0ABW8P881_9FLAO|nr:DUF3987 domain-containing protein [Flavobacterium oreochromis]OWP78542.1 hypothetical protein BWG23_01905 [Flavobacterium oreochromis]